MTALRFTLLASVVVLASACTNDDATHGVGASTSDAADDGALDTAASVCLKSTGAGADCSCTAYGCYRLSAADHYCTSGHAAIYCWDHGADGGSTPQLPAGCTGTGNEGAPCSNVNAVGQIICCPVP